MNWLLVALVTYTNSATPDLKIHAGLRFANSEVCRTYVQENKEFLKKQLLTRYPNIEKSIIQCFDEQSVKEMHRYMFPDN